VFPRPSGYDIRDCWLSAFEAPCNLKLRIFSRGIYFSDFSNLISGQRGSIVFFASFFVFHGATFLDHVFHVFLVGRQEKMIGADAGGVIATVTNAKRFLKRAIMEFVTKSVGEHRRFSRVKTAVTIGTPTRQPNPTTVCLNNLFPKTIHCRFCLHD